MPYGMAQVEQGSHALFRGILKHDLYLDGRAAADHLEDALAVRCRDLLPVLLQERKEIGIGKKCRLDHFPHSRRKLLRRKSQKRVRVRINQRRHVEGPDHILIALEIHAGLSADTGINLRQERRRNLDDPDPSPVDSRGKSGHIPRHPASERGNTVLSVELELQKLVQQ